MEKELETIHKNVKLLLTKFPELRNPFLRKQAHIKYWQEFEGLGNFGISFSQYIKLTSAETISRAIRGIQKENQDLRPSKEIQQKQFEIVEKYRQSYLAEQKKLELKKDYKARY